MVAMSAPLRMDEASTARRITSVNETQTAEIHQGIEDDAMKPAVREGFDENLTLGRITRKVRAQESLTV